MSEHLVTRITRQKATFSKGQSRIASYILENTDTAAFMTALSLGKTVGVSESTVVRFASMLGYDGYPELQKAMQELIRSKLTTIQRIEVTRARMEDAAVPDNIMAYDLANVRQTLEELPRDVFAKAVDTVAVAGRLYIFGAGSCRALATFAAYYFKLLLPDIRLISASSEAEIFEEMIHIGEEDALLGLSFPRYSAKAVRAVHFARSRGAKVITITDSELSPIATMANYLLLAHSDMATIVDSLVAPLSVLNALIVAVSLKTIDRSRSVLDELEGLWESYGVYEPPQSG